MSTAHIPELDKQRLSSVIKNFIHSLPFPVEFVFVHRFEFQHDGVYFLDLSKFSSPGKIFVVVYLLRETDIDFPSGHYICFLKSPQSSYIFDSLNMDVETFKKSFKLILPDIPHLTNYKLQEDEMPTCGYWCFFAVYFFLKGTGENFNNFIRNQLNISKINGYEILNQKLYQWWLSKTNSGLHSL